MFAFRRKITTAAVRFCERCGSVCSAGCAAEAQRQRTMTQLLSQGWRVA